MNSFPPLDLKAAKRAERAAQAAEQVKVWTNTLKEQHLSAGMFFMAGPLVDSFLLFLGALAGELETQGYEIASHTQTPVGQEGNVIVAHWTFLVRAKGPHAPTILLA